MTQLIIPCRILARLIEANEAKLANKPGFRGLPSLLYSAQTHGDVAYWAKGVGLRAVWQWFSQWRRVVREHHRGSSAAFVGVASWLALVWAQRNLHKNLTWR